MPWETRCQQLRQALTEQGLPAVLCCDLANIAYLTGFRGDAGWLLVTAREVLLFTDGRFETQAKEELRIGEANIIADDLLEAVASAITDRRLASLGFEAQALSFATHQRLAAKLDGVSMRPTESVVENLRLRKDPGELQAIERTLRLTETALRQVAADIGIGVTETEVAAELEHTMRRLGAEKPAFDTIVAFGPRAALPHARPTARELGGGDAVLIDMGGTVDGYCADITRTFFLGEPIAPAQTAYRAVLAAQQAGLSKLVPGLPCSEAHRAAREALEAYGLAQAFKHSLGHGVGIQVHEGPRVSQKSKDHVASGMVVTVEPGVYVEGQFGIRVEEMAAIEAHGPRVLNAYPNSLEEMILEP